MISIFAASPALRVTSPKMMAAPKPFDRGAGGATPFAQFNGGGSAGDQTKWAQGGDVLFRNGPADHAKDPVKTETPMQGRVVPTPRAAYTQVAAARRSRVSRELTQRSRGAPAGPPAARRRIPSRVPHALAPASLTGAFLRC
jgi:hypothetical protein